SFVLLQTEDLSVSITAIILGQLVMAFLIEFGFRSYLQNIIETKMNTFFASIIVGLLYSICNIIMYFCLEYIFYFFLYIFFFFFYCNYIYIISHGILNRIFLPFLFTKYYRNENEHILCIDYCWFIIFHLEYKYGL